LVVSAACPQLGKPHAGLIASATSPGLSAVIGRLAAVARAALIAVSSPAFLHYRHTDAANDPAAG
jgi:hypothetical protein